MMVSGRILSPRIVDESMENMWPPEMWPVTYVPIRITSLLISILGIIGNGMLIYLLIWRINRTRFINYVLNISIADFFIILDLFLDNVYFFKPSELISSISPLRYLSYLLGNDASISFLTVISAERYLMVFFPVWYHAHRPKHFTDLMCTVVWVLSLIITLLKVYSCHPKDLINRHLKCDAVISVHFIYNCILVILSSSLVFVSRIQRQTQCNFPTRLDISIMAAVIRTLIFWLPVKIVDILHLWVPHKYFPHPYGIIFISESIYSSVCPYLYLVVGWWKSQELQRSIPIFIKRALMHTEEETSTRTQKDQELA